ncbi:MAG: hypothetical protein ACHQF2_11505 [Flavobacteriales bacterium]
MRVHYNKAWGLMFVILSSILLILHLYLASLTGKFLGLNMLTAFIILLAGIMYLTRPYFELTTTEIRLLAPLGYAVRTYTFSSYSEIQLIDNKLYLEKDGTRKRIRITKWMCNPQEWQTFMATIRGEDDTLLKELHDLK